MRKDGRFDISVKSSENGGINIHASMVDGDGDEIADGVFRLDEESTIGFVRQICRKAGLPNPWEGS